MYSKPWHDLKDSCFLDWPACKEEKSVEDVAHTFIKQYRFCKDDIIIGSSLGGMVGLEIAQRIGIKKVVLLGSAIHADELSIFSKALVPLAKSPLVKLSQFTAKAFKNNLTLAYAKTDPGFIVNMSKAIKNWRGFSGDMRLVTRIHGKYDPLITCPKDGHIIKRGGHLIAFTHARTCIDILKSHSIF